MGPQDFDNFVRQHEVRLLRAAFLLTGDWGAAQDLVQVALERSWPRWDQLMTDGHRLAYVQRVLTTSFLRSARRRWNLEVPTERLPDASVADASEAADQREALRACMQALSPRLRAVVTLRFLADLSEGQTAAAMGCTVGTVKRYSWRALEALRNDPRMNGFLHERSGHERT